ncbi:hypothetical protein LV476_05270 [Guyparkeria hydrothermalis]|uniref:hypothetical protein n=1 Tax=Guyparkeria hydrothermalis TaxID=923 RepID=UPI002022418B|nr:hypothetical protein [Guyparkeria hydrothermalis]MCL7744362.1 hypothetical protein [Guyparkeria hydrothermalis]
MATLASLTVDIATNTAKFSRGIEKVDRRLKRFDRGIAKARRAAQGLFAIAGSVGAASLVTRSLEAADAAHDYAKALGTTTEALTSMQYAADKVQVPAEKLRDILKDTSEKIGDAYATGGGEAVDALDALGLSAEQLVKLSPDKQLLAIADQLDNVGTQAEKIQIMESLGNDASLLLPLLDDNARAMRRFMQEAVDTGRALDDDLADKASKANEQLKNIRSQISADFTNRVAENAEQITRLAEALGDVAEGAMWAADKFASFSESLGEGAAKIVHGSADATERLREQIKRLHDVQNDPTPISKMLLSDADAALIKRAGGVQEAIDMQTKALDSLREAERRIAQQRKAMQGLPSSPLAAIASGSADTMSRTKEQAKQIARLIDRYKEMGATAGMSAVEIARYRLEQAGATESEIKGALASVRHAEAIEAHQKAVEKQREKMERAAEDARIYGEALDDAAKAVLDGLDPMRVLKRELEELDELFVRGRLSINQWAEATRKKSNEALMNGFAEDLRKLEAASEDSADSMSVFWEQAARNMQDSMSTFFFDVMQGDFDNMADGFKRTIDKMVSDLMASQLLDYLGKGNASSGGSWLEGLVGNLAGGIFGSGGGTSWASSGAQVVTGEINTGNGFANFSSIFGGGRAIGGPVSAGTPYMVGEHGPELFVPDSSGTVRSAQNSGQGMNVVNHFSITTPDARGMRAAEERIAARVGDSIMRAQRRNR